VIARIAEPCSKLRTAEILKRDYAKRLSENQIYKLMDLVVNEENSVKLRIFETTKKLCPVESSIVKDKETKQKYKIPSKCSVKRKH
jgi:hypothetical protein